MKSEAEIRERRDGCMVERDGNLHPQVDDPVDAAFLQGMVDAFDWVLGNEMDYSRVEEIRERLEKYDND